MVTHAKINEQGNSPPTDQGRQLGAALTIHFMTTANLQYLADTVIDLIKNDQRLDEEMIGASWDRKVKIGEMLTEINNHVGHGNWGPWVKANLTINYRQAWKYIQCFKQQDELSNLHSGGDLSLNAAMKLLAVPKKKNPPKDVEIEPEVEQLPEPVSEIEGSDVNSLMLGVAEALKRVTAEFNLFRLDDQGRESLRAWMVIIEEQLFGIRIMAGLPNPTFPPDDENEAPPQKAEEAHRESRSPARTEEAPSGQ